MTSLYKVLGQLAPGAASLSPVYTVPALTSAVISTIHVCERGGAAATFRISIAIAGAVDDPSQYLCYDSPIAANDAVDFTEGFTLGPGDIVRIYASSANLTIQVFGEEIS